MEKKVSKTLQARLDFASRFWSDKYITLNSDLEQIHNMNDQECEEYDNFYDEIVSEHFQQASDHANKFINEDDEVIFSTND